MFQLLKWRWMAGTSESASGRKTSRRVWIVGAFIKVQHVMWALAIAGNGAVPPYLCSLLFLALRAPECRATILGEAPHDAAAACGLAFFAFAVVDLE